MTKKSIYKNLRLEDEEGNDFSANPSDYWNMDLNKTFENQDLVVTEYKDEWKRDKIVKHNPKKKDLIKWNKIIKTYTI